MATVIDANKNLIKLNDGKTITAQAGGWYDGQQYWNGSFGAPNVINNPNQQGYGQGVSREVREQSAAAQGVSIQNFDSYLAKSGASGANLPQSAAEITPFLNNFQSTIYGAGNSIATRSPEEIRSLIEPDRAAPEPINYVELFEEYREKYGVAGLESQMNELKAEQDEIFATRRQRSQQEEGKPVATGVIAGRVTEIERQENERLDANQRALSRVTDQLNTSYSAINTMMQLTKMTYEDAVGTYEREWNQNMAIYGLIEEEEDEARDEARYQQQIASANLQTYVNLITSGNLDPAGMSPEQQTQLAKLSVQAGFPPDFMARVQVNPQDKMLFANQETGQVVFMDANGQVSVQQIAGYKTGGGSSSAKREDYVASLKKDARDGLTLSQIFSIYSGYLEPDEIYTLYNSSSRYGPDKGSITNLAKYGVTQPKSSSSSGREP